MFWVLIVFKEKKMNPKTQKTNQSSFLLDKLCRLLVRNTLISFEVKTAQTQIQHQEARRGQDIGSGHLQAVPPPVSLFVLVEMSTASVDLLCFIHNALTILHSPVMLWGFIYLCRHRIRCYSFMGSGLSS